MSTSTSSTTFPRSLDLLDFATSRLHEIKSLTSILNNNTSGNKRTFQLLPHHLRRRAMSHNIRRIPRKLRKNAYKEVEKDSNLKIKMEKQEKKNRRLYRRNKYLLNKKYNKDRIYKWLETHIWHSKRFHMDNLWDYRIPLYPNDKGIRATYKANNICSIYDSSYTSCIKIYGNVSLIINLFKLITPLNVSSVGNQMVLNGQRERDVFIYKPNKYPYNSIGPIKYHWIPLKDVNINDNGIISINNLINTLWIWVHPSISEEIINSLNDAKKLIINDSNGTDMVGSLNDIIIEKVESIGRLEMTGRASHSILQAALSPSTPNEIWTLLSKVPCPSSLPPSTIFNLDIQDPAYFSPRQPFATIANRAIIANPTTPLDGDDFELLTNWPVDASFSRIFDDDMRKSLMVKFEERKKNCAGQLNIALSNPTSIPILFIQRPGAQRGFGTGYSIIIPSGWIMAVWMALNYAGARAVGLNDMIAHSLESCRLPFPIHSPDNLAGCMYSNYISKDKIAKYDKTPTQKKLPFKLEDYQLQWNAILSKNWKIICTVKNEESELKKRKVRNVTSVSAPSVPILNHTTLLKSYPVDSLFIARDRFIFNCFSNPRDNVSFLKAISTGGKIDFLPNFDFSQALIPVYFELYKGVPNDNALIMEASESDLLKWEGGNDEDSKFDEIEVDESIQERFVIGAVCSGSYSIHRGCGFGIGYCSLQQLAKLQIIAINRNLRKIVAITKNSSSDKARFCLLNVVEQYN